VFLFLFHGGHLHLQFCQRFIHLAWLGGCQWFLGFLALLGCDPRITLHAAVVTLMVVPLAILVIFFVASTFGGVVLILLLLRMPIRVVLQIRWLRYSKEELFILSRQPGHPCLQVGNWFSIPRSNGRWGRLLISLGH
jgi:hypothetical protein